MRHKVRVFWGFVIATASTWGMMQFITPNDVGTQWFVILIVDAALFAGTCFIHEPLYSKNWEWNG